MSRGGGRRSPRSDLDVRDLPDREEADGHHDETHPDEDATDELREEGLHELRVDHVEYGAEADRQERDDVTGDPALGGQRGDLALDPHALADREGDRVEDLGQVATDLLLDPDGRDHEVEVIALDPPDDVLERLF